MLIWVNMTPEIIAVDLKPACKPFVIFGQSPLSTELSAHEVMVNLKYRF
jgi:hypothetical protein